MQKQLDAGNLKIKDNGVILNSNDYIIFDLKLSEINFENGKFNYFANGDVTGVSPIGVEDFVNWINLRSQIKWQITNIEEIEISYQMGISYLSEWYTANYKEEIFFLTDKNEYVFISKDDKIVTLKKNKPSEFFFRLERIKIPKGKTKLAKK